MFVKFTILLREVVVLSFSLQSSISVCEYTTLIYSIVDGCLDSFHVHVFWCVLFCWIYASDGIVGSKGMPTQRVAVEDFPE